MMNKVLKAAPVYTQRRQKPWRTLIRKERWGLSWRGWLIVLAVIVLTFFLFWFRVYPFLAVTHRVDPNVLVVEGWIHEYAIGAAVQEFQTNSYQRVFAKGDPVEETGGYTKDYNTSASVGADLLKKSGLPVESVQMVPSRVMDRDRTYSSAIALRNWFRKHNMSVHSVNVITENLHARRTRLLFGKALCPETSVGINAVPNPDYDPSCCWRYSEGVKDVTSEAVTYLQARFLFYPSDLKRDLRGRKALFHPERPPTLRT